MCLKTIVFDSEVEFRECVIQHLNDIYKIIIFEDVPDKIIFFYCFAKKGLILSAKEPSIKKFCLYKKRYYLLAEKHSFSISSDLYQLTATKSMNH